MARPAQTRCKRRPAQLGLRFRTWGGARKGAGRKPGLLRRTAHRGRPRLASRYPVHVTLRVDDSLPDLRGEHLSPEIEECLGQGKEREGFRLVHYSILSHHLHLIVEAQNADALTQGIRGLCVRLARRINRVTGRRGRVFTDRYHARILKTPREVKNALRYALCNVRRHAARHGRQLLSGWMDNCSSGRFFDGWRGGWRGPPDDEEPKVAAPRTWLLAKGWRRWGLISIDDVPGPQP